MSYALSRVAMQCENCGTALVGDYCHACGQHRLEGDELTVSHAVRAAASDLGNFESKTLRSMLMLFRPGRLTETYLAGRRVAFTSPLKLYFVCAAITFLLAPFTGLTLEQMVEKDPNGPLASFIHAEIAASGIDPDLFAERFEARFQNIYTVGLAPSIVAGAAMLAWLFRKQRRPFGAHVVYELHYVSFLYVVTIVLAGVMLALPQHPLTGAVLMMLVLVPYQWVALRRVYGERGWRLVWKLAVMIVFALIFDSLINFMALWITVKSI